MKIYIAGPMSGIEDWNFPAFFEAEEQLKELGHETLNPATNDGASLETAIQNAISARDSGATWSSYMRRDLSNLVLSDSLCLLPGWQSSKGASLEVYVAKALGIPLYILRDGKLEPRITCIGFAGWARSGKDTAAAYLVENYGYTRMSFAAPMKEALYRLNPRITINNVLGTPIRTGVDIYGWDDLKEHGPEVRELLQRFGTEVGREMFGENFWVEYALQNVSDGSKVVVSDVRYPNEADAIKALGGSVWRINRLGVFAANDHASEHALDNYDFDGVIDNSSSISELNRQLEGVLINGEVVRAEIR
jgi:hypothetical protein